ncbi:LysM peptidoglycan-binding domain-containing protein [bacterium]|nr:LysM peptidoglycan-binding domain-containing protein [bacterium]
MDRKIVFPDLALVSDQVIHVVQRGETLKTIAKSYGVKPDELYEANLGLIHLGRFCAGRRILIPGPASKSCIVSERDVTAFELQYRAKANVLQHAKEYWEGVLRQAFELESVTISGSRT